MKLLSWNRQGLGNPLTVRLLTSLYKDYSPDIIFFDGNQEPSYASTKAGSSSDVSTSAVFYPQGISGGFLLLWTDAMDVHIQSIGSFFVICSVHMPDGFSFDVILCHFNPCLPYIIMQFNVIKQLALYLLPNFVILGDFNDIIAPIEKMGGLAYDYVSHPPFLSYIKDLQLFDLSYLGTRYTWSNHRQWPNHIQKRLDRGFGSPTWIHHFQGTSILRLLAIASDHHPILLQTHSFPIVRSSQFIFFINVGLNLQSIFTRLKCIRHNLVNWRKHNQLNSSKVITDLTHQLQGISNHSSNSTDWFFVKDLEYQLYRHIERRNYIDIVGHSLDYFQALFTSGKPNPDVPFLAEFPCRITSQMNAILIKPITALEVKTALWGINPTKSPGADGLTNFIFQHYWDILHQDITSSIIKFFQGVHRPQSVKDLRPISLCTIYYKIISKILTTRLQHILPSILDISQNAFVKGRSIADNILLMNEMLHFLGIKKQGKQVTYSIRINGGLHGYFKPSKRIRQGDPLSPLLFVLCAEVSRTYHEPPCPTLTHLFFADDSILFTSATNGQISVILEILHQYAYYSGQFINYAKSTVFFSNNIPSDWRSHFSSTLGVSDNAYEGTYLDLPLCILHSKTQTFAPLLSKICLKLHCWKEHFLFMSGKEILLKAIVEAIPVYSMMCFQLPVSFFNLKLSVLVGSST
ncbi:uncharacterized protein LOC126686586 [Mercurialis annua]|uniref:uncharacterized protein LOC126686586 n=1 Tax=Mercurialis annua TaxID=3986 RepID=UPI0024AE9917|nr:uncharacterized protein LOC126686586 [Mercurialis annua]